MFLTFSFSNFLAFLGIFTVIVVTVFLFEFRRIRSSLMAREREMTQRMYQLSILRELGERIGYSLKIDQIVEIIAGSLRRLLEYSTVAYLLKTSTPDGKAKLIFNINLERPVNKKFIDSVKALMLNSFNAITSSSYVQDDLEETVSGTITDPTASETVGSFFNVPIVIGGMPVGLLNIASLEKDKFKEKEVEVLFTIMSQASDAVSKLEHVLKIEKGKLISTVSSMADGVLMIDTTKQLSIINSAAKKMLGITDEMPTIFDVLDALSNTFDLRTKLEESIAGDKLVVIPSITLVNRVAQVLISPVKDEGDNYLGAVVLFHDITKEKELEKMREDFTNMMVHELRSPLTGIKSIASLLLSDAVKKDGKKYSEFVGLISNNSQEMLGLVNDLLDVAKLESGKFQLLEKASDIKRIVSERVSSYSALASQNNIQLIARIDPGVPAALVFDEHKIIQVLNNFISNSLKFTNTGGSVTVSVFLLSAASELAAEVVRRAWVWPGIKKGTVFSDNRLVVAVTDTGTGIPEDKIPQLFNKFVQLENAARSEKKGTGLGLVVSKGIVEAHRGTIGVFSEEGEGSTFYFTLPMSAGGVPSPISVAPAQAAAPAAK